MSIILDRSLVAWFVAGSLIIGDADLRYFWEYSVPYSQNYCSDLGYSLEGAW